MGLIRSIRLPLAETEGLGLKPLQMARLGRLVALAGKNGAGKSRILQLVQLLVARRAAGLSSLQGHRQQVDHLTRLIAQTPQDPNRGQWEAQRAQSIREIAYALDYIESDATSFKAVEFVPKRLALDDWRHLSRAEMTQRAVSANSDQPRGVSETALSHIQVVQNRWWNAEHQGFKGSPEQKHQAISEYRELCSIVAALLGSPLLRNLDDDATLFGKPIADAGLSDGQKVLLQLAVSLHAQRARLDRTVFILDELENHLHPSAAVDFLSKLYEAAPNSQIWLATHSIPLLAYVCNIDPMALWFVDEGRASHAGRHPEYVLNGLLGDEDRIAQLHAFTSLPAELAASNYALQCLAAPAVVADGSGDAQVTQIASLISSLRVAGRPLRVLDYGAGKGRLLDGLSEELQAKGEMVSDVVDYYAFDEYEGDSVQCEAVIAGAFGTATGRYFRRPEDFFSSREDGSIDLVVMCNVLHEIPPSHWLSTFESTSLIGRALRHDGAVLIVEDQRIPTGEKAHEYGFLVLDTPHLRTLFKVTSEDVAQGLFSAHDARGDGRLKAHLVAKPLLHNVGRDSRYAAIEQLQTTARDSIARCRQLPTTYANGLLHAFWVQEFANASLFLAHT